MLNSAWRVGPILRSAAASAFFIYSAFIAGQTPPGPSFEVASIKLSRTNNKPSVISSPGGRTVATNETLKYLIGFAYGVREYQIVGGPKWIDSDEYDIDARPPAAFQPSLSTRPYVMKMMQSLLEERFRLSLSRSSRELPVYALIVGKNGSKLKERAKPETPSDMKMTGANGSLTAQGLPIAILAESFSSILGRQVNDETGLTGYYDFRLEWTPEEMAANARSDNTGPSIFTAVQEQLGLRLEARRGPVEVLVVQAATRPSAN
jgi:uncharacterized protein (TIGR03435 family)